MKTKNNLNTLVLGLEHFIDKIGYQAYEYMNNGLSVKYLVSDKSQTSMFYAKKYSADVEILPRNKVISSLLSLLTLIKFRPAFVELYDTGNMFIVYLFLCFITRRKVIVVYRGGELHRSNSNKFSFNYIKHLFASKIAFRVVAKEKNILEEYKKNGFSLVKLRYLHNCVPISLLDNVNGQRQIDLLFLNSIRKQRNVPFLIEVVARLREVLPDISVVIAGFNSLDNKNLSFDIQEEEHALNLIKERGLQDTIKVLGFVKNPVEFHLNSKLFLFPADIVFANYSLLESMACGCVPVVADGEGAEMIVTDQEGSVIELDSTKWVDAIFSYLNDNALLQKKSLQSCKKIDAEFSMSAWFKKMIELRQD